MIKDILKGSDVRMQTAIVSLEEDLSGIRTGRANPSLVERLPVDYFGAPTPLMQLASISVPEPRCLLIRPYHRQDNRKSHPIIRPGLNPR